MTNFEKWQLYMKDFSSPQSFVDAGFYYLIGAALQRRVWTGPEHSPLYPNTYIILTGEPGIGKGLVIKQVESILKHFKLENPNIKIAAGEKIDNVSKATSYVEQAENYAAATKDKRGLLEADKPLLIPVAPNSVTFQALVKANALAYRTINYNVFDESLGKEITKTAVHSSLCFCLEEIASLFKQDTRDVVNYLIQAYDCGDYEHDTKTQGRDRVSRCCLAFFGGTTPSFMRSTFDDKLVGEGFSSRTIFVYEAANRHNKLFIPELTEEQKKAREDILKQVKMLTTLYGHAIYTPEALDFLTYWYEKVHPTHKANNNAKLIPYYSRKGLHAQKLAAAIHFGESLSMTIGIEPCKKAVEWLDKIELKMHYAVSFDNKNPLAEPARKIQSHIDRVGPQTRKDLFVEFFGDVRDIELNEILEYLTTTGKLFSVNVCRKKDGAAMGALFTQPEINWELYGKSNYKQIE